MQCSICALPCVHAVSMYCPVCACTSAFSTSPMASSRAAVCWKAMPITSTSTSLGVLPMAASCACSPYNKSNAVSFLLGFFHQALRSQLRSTSLLATASMGAGRRSMSPEVVGCCFRALASMRAKKLRSSPVPAVLIGLTARASERVAGIANETERCVGMFDLIVHARASPQTNAAKESARFLWDQLSIHCIITCSSFNTRSRKNSRLKWRHISHTHLNGTGNRLHTTHALDLHHYRGCPVQN